MWEKSFMTQIPQIRLSEAIEQLREELRQAVLEGDNDIVFTPNNIDVEFGVNFTA